MDERLFPVFGGKRKLIFIDESTIEVTIIQVIMNNSSGVIALVDEDGHVYNWNMIAIAEKRA